MVIDKIKLYCSGENVSFEGFEMDWSTLSPFQQKVLNAARKIPYGSVATYGSLARKIGCPRGSRAVGNALAKNPFPLVIPCHRIIRGGWKTGWILRRRGNSTERKNCYKWNSFPHNEPPCSKLQGIKRLFTCHCEERSDAAVSL